MMSSTQGAFSYQVKSGNDFRNPSDSAKNAMSMQSDSLDIEQFMLDNNPQQQITSLDQSASSPLDVVGASPFGSEFPFPYPGTISENGSQPDSKFDKSTDPYGVTGPGSTPGHQNSITSLPAGSGAGFNSAHPRKASVSGSDDASPSSNRASGAGLDSGYTDEFSMNSGRATEGSDAGSKSKDGKTVAPPPPWSELKTKAGKERKRLPLACIACRRKKIRCSGEKPACKHCLRSRIPCVYKVTTRKAAPRTDYMAMLDKRLKRMEERIIKIVPKEEQDATVSVTRAVVKPPLPGTTPTRTSGKKRGAEEAFGQELENWSKSVSTAPTENGAKPTSLLIQEAEEGKLLLEGAEALPPKDIQEHLAEIFFENVYGQTYHLLHKPSFMRKLRAGTVPPVLVLTVCAVSARFSTHPKLNTAPAFLRGEEWASEARDIVMRRYEWPNITILTCLIILGLHEFGTCQGGRSWALGGQAIRMAYALQLHKDLDYDPLKHNGTAELSFIDREIRRRTMWACFLMDRFNSSGTDRPTFMKEETMKIQLPIREKYFQLDMPGPTENLRGDVPYPISDSSGGLSDAHDNMGVAAYMIRSIALWGRIINYLNLGGNELDPHPMWHPESTYAELIKQTEAFIDELPDFLKYRPENLRTHDTEGLANQFLFLHVSIQQNILFMNRFAVPAQPGGRPPKDVPKEFVTKAGAKAFEAANKISEILRDGESYFICAPFTGYCAFLSSTVHVFGVFSKNAIMEASSKRNLATNVKYLSKMKRYWGMFHWMSENLKEQYKMCADAARQGPSANSNPAANHIFQYGDWFDRYPHGVSQSAFEDPASGIKQEKGDDAVLEQKSDYHTVEEFFQTLSPLQPQDKAVAKPVKQRKVRRGQAPQQEQQDQSEELQTEIADDMAHMVPQQQMQMPSAHTVPQFNQMSPSATVNMYPQGYYNNDLFLPPHQQGILPHLDRQLVFGAYAGMDPTSLSSQNMLDSANAWDIQMGGMTGFTNEPSSAWFMPFNMEPPEINQDGDVFSSFGTMGGFSMDGMHVNNGGNGLGGQGNG